MQYVTRFNLQPLQGGAFREWLTKNDALLREGQAQGWTYLGAWFTVHGFGRYDVELRYEVGDYANLCAGFGSEALQKAWIEASDMILPGQGEVSLLFGSARRLDAYRMISSKGIPR